MTHKNRPQLLPLPVGWMVRTWKTLNKLNHLTFCICKGQEGKSFTSLASLNSLKLRVRACLMWWPWRSCALCSRWICFLRWICGILASGADQCVFVSCNPLDRSWPWGSNQTSVRPPAQTKLEPNSSSFSILWATSSTSSCSFPVCSLHLFGPPHPRPQKLCPLWSVNISSSSLACCSWALKSLKISSLKWLSALRTTRESRVPLLICH